VDLTDIIGWLLYCGRFPIITYHSKLGLYSSLSVVFQFFCGVSCQLLDPFIARFQSCSACSSSVLLLSIENNGVLALRELVERLRPYSDDSVENSCCAVEMF